MFKGQKQQTFSRNVALIFTHQSHRPAAASRTSAGAERPLLFCSAKSWAGGDLRNSLQHTGSSVNACLPIGKTFSLCREVFAPKFVEKEHVSGGTNRLEGDSLCCRCQIQFYLSVVCFCSERDLLTKTFTGVTEVFSLH